jgi:hypothetical protein
MLEDTAPMHANAPDAVSVFTVRVTVRGDFDLETQDLLEGILEAQGEILGRVFNDALDLHSWANASVDLFDPSHPDDPDELVCGCVGPEGWHCPGEESEHWADSFGGCGHCGWTPDP